MDPCPRPLVAILASLALAVTLPTGALAAPSRSGHRDHRSRATTAHGHGQRHRRIRQRRHGARSARRRPNHHGGRHAAARGHAGSMGPCSGQSLLPTAGNLAQVRQATLCLINRERQRHGERALRENAHLQRAAQDHTESMVSKDYFSHYGPGGQTPEQRMRATGYIPGGNVGWEVGENIAWGTLGLASPHAIVAAWMHSPEHRANILDARYRDTAIGVLASVPSLLADSMHGATYTQDFGVIVTG